MMTDKIRYIATTLAVVLFFGIFSIWTILRPADEFSDTERRPLKQLPEISFQSVASGDFMKLFDEYTPDQFPLRESFRSIKAFFATKVFLRGDNNGIYEVDGVLSKLDYPLDEDSVTHAAERFEFIYNLYVKPNGAKAYLAVIPDKNYFLAEENGYPAIDYDTLYNKIYAQTEFLTPIELRDVVKAEDFYKTDTHLRQENLLPLADKLLEAMGSNADAKYNTVALDNLFHGVYDGQSALNPEADTLYYLTNETLENCKVFDYQNGKETTVYDLEKGSGKDPYELFLSGPLSLITIENPEAETEKELVVFRDSFGSAIAPLLVEDYSKITLVDIRYQYPMLLCGGINFEGSDVLFLYSTSVLNNSETLK